MWLMLELCCFEYKLLIILRWITNSSNIVLPKNSAHRSSFCRKCVLLSNIQQELSEEFRFVITPIHHNFATLRSEGKIFVKMFLDYLSNVKTSFIFSWRIQNIKTAYIIFRNNWRLGKKSIVAEFLARYTTVYFFEVAGFYSAETSSCCGRDLIFIYLYIDYVILCRKIENGGLLLKILSETVIKN